MVDVSQDGVLRDNMINLSKLDDVRLLQTFHGEELSSLLIFS